MRQDDIATGCDRATEDTRCDDTVSEYADKQGDEPEASSPTWRSPTTDDFEDPLDTQPPIDDDTNFPPLPGSSLKRTSGSLEDSPSGARKSTA